MPELSAIRNLLLHRQFLPARLKLGSNPGSGELSVLAIAASSVISIFCRFETLTSPIPASMPKGKPRIYMRHTK
jgi:hypothetical protein